MSLRSTISRILGVGLVFCLATSESRADVLTQTFAFPTGALVNLSDTNWFTAFNVQQFDGAAHPLNGASSTLQSVTLTMEYEFNNTLEATHTSLSTITVNASGSVFLDAPNDTTLLLSGGFTNSGSNTASNSTVDFGAKSVTDSKTATYTDASSLAEFSGTGTISLPAAAAATSDFSSTSGNGFGKSLTTAGVVLTVTYTYVPEPGSFVLMGLGGLSFLAVSYRRARLARVESQSI